VVACVQDLAERHAGTAVVLVSHVGPIKTLLCTAMGVPLTTGQRLFLDSATVSMIDWGARRYRGRPPPSCGCITRITISAGPRRRGCNAPRLCESCRPPRVERLGKCRDDAPPGRSCGTGRGHAPVVPAPPVALVGGSHLVEQGGLGQQGQ
jgi:hypothetical protein